MCSMFAVVGVFQVLQQLGTSLYPCLDSATVRLEVCVFSFASLVWNRSTSEPSRKRVAAIFDPGGSGSVAKGAPGTGDRIAHPSLRVSEEIARGFPVNNRHIV